MERIDAREALAYEKAMTPTIINTMPNSCSSELTGEISPYPTVVIVVTTT